MGEKYAVANLDTGRTLVRVGRVLLVLATVAPFLRFAFAARVGAAGGMARAAAEPESTRLRPYLLGQEAG
jgi:hypothetical protein